MSGDTLTFAEQVAADPRGYWYYDSAPTPRPRWGDKRSAKKTDLAATPWAKQLMNPRQAEEAGVEWPCLMAASARTEPPRAETPTTPPEAVPVPNYDNLAAELPEEDLDDDTEEGGPGDMAAALADPAQLQQLVELASDGVLDLLVYAAYIGSPVPEAPPTARERKMWRDALVGYVKSKAGTVEVTPEMLLFGTVAVIMGPRLVQGQSHHVVKLVTGMKRKQAAAQKPRAAA